jgi:hypothetical protein
MQVLSVFVFEAQLRDPLCPRSCPALRKGVVSGDFSDPELPFWLVFLQRERGIRFAQRVDAREIDRSTVLHSATLAYARRTCPISRAAQPHCRYVGF